MCCCELNVCDPLLSILISVSLPTDTMIKSASHPLCSMFSMLYDFSLRPRSSLCYVYFVLFALILSLVVSLYSTLSILSVSSMLCNLVPRFVLLLVLFVLFVLFVFFVLFV